MENYRRLGLEPPADVAEPLPLPEVSFLFEAFHELGTDRQIGFGGAGPIPWSSLDRYAERHGLIDPDERDRFIRMIRAMDAVWLEHMASKAESKEPPK